MMRLLKLGGLTVFVFAVLMGISVGHTQEIDDSDIYQDDLIAFDYPTGWFLCECAPEENTIAVGNTESAPSSTDLQTGEVQVLVVKSVEQFLIDYQVLTSINEMDALDILSIFSQGDRKNFITMEDSEATYFFAPGEDLDSLFLITPLDIDLFAMIIATARPRALSDPDLMAAVLGIGGSMRLPEVEPVTVPTVLDETYRARGVTFDYPAAWAVQPDGDILIIVNDERILSYNSVGELKRGEYVLFLYPTLDVLEEVAGYPLDMIPDSDTLEVVTFFASLMLGQGYEQQFAAENLLIDAREASHYLGRSSDHEQMLISIFTDDEDDVITIFAFGAPRTLLDLEQLLHDLIATVEVR